MIKEIDEKYHSVIANMQKVFKEEYDKSLTDNTLKDIDKISDKGQLNNAKTKLNELLQTIQNEKDIICMEDEVKEYETKITNLIKSCEDRITKIEEEEKKAAEEEARKQAEAYRIPVVIAVEVIIIGHNSSNGGSSGSSGSWSRYEMPDGSWTHYDHNNDGSWTAHDNEGNSWTSDDLKEWLD